MNRAAPHSYPPQPLRSLPILLGWVLALCLAHPGPSAANEAGVDLTLALGQRSEHILTVSNASEQVWTFDRARSSCPCVAIQSFPALVFPHASAEVVVAVTGKKVGRFNYTVQLIGADDTPGQTLFLPTAVRPASPASGMQFAALQERDHGLYLGAASARAQTAGPRDWIILDLRGTTSRANYGFPGARVMRGPAARSLPYDRSRPILLVDEGWGSARTERVCRRLRAEGHTSVHILRGGAASWIAAGGAEPRNAVGLHRLAAVSADDYTLQQVYGDWRTVVLSGDSEGAALSLPPDMPDEAITRAVEELLEREEDPVRLLIVARDRYAASRGAAAARRAGADVVFFLAEGQDGLRREHGFHQHLRLASRQTMTTVSRNGTPRTGPGGCGGCP